MQKGKQLQAAANNFQQKLQNNGFTSREQAASAQAAIQLVSALLGRQDVDCRRRAVAETEPQVAALVDAGEKDVLRPVREDAVRDIVVVEKVDIFALTHHEHARTAHRQVNRRRIVGVDGKARRSADNLFCLV